MVGAGHELSPAGDRFARARAGSDREDVRCPGGSVPSFDRERETASGWLFSIARHKLQDSLRRARVEASARSLLGWEQVAITDEDLEPGGGAAGRPAGSAAPACRRGAFVRRNRGRHALLGDGGAPARASSAALPKTIIGGSGMSALEEIERQLLKSVAARAQPAERDSRARSESVARPVGAKRRRRGWRSLWSGGRLGVVLAAVVLASGVAAAAVLLDQPSAPLAGRVPAGQQPGYAVAGGYRYRISLVPSLQVGQIGWCAAITITSRSGQLDSLGTGSCGDAPTRGAPLFATQVGQGLSFLFTAASVRAIQLPGHRPVLGGAERAAAERIARGWLIVTGGQGIAQQQLLLSRLTGRIVSAARRQ